MQIFSPTLPLSTRCASYAKNPTSRSFSAGGLAGGSSTGSASIYPLLPKVSTAIIIYPIVFVVRSILITIDVFASNSVVTFAGGLGDDGMMEEDEEEIVCPQCSSSRLSMEIFLFLLRLCQEW